MDQRRKWHLNRGINLDTLLALIAMVCAFGVWMMNQESRVVKLEDAIIRLDATDKNIMDRSHQERQEIRDDIKEIKEQVNKLVERRPK